MVPKVAPKPFQIGFPEVKPKLSETEPKMEPKTASKFAQKYLFGPKMLPR